MTNPIFYKRISGSSIQGNADNVVEPYGTLVVTNNNELRLHDGTVAGGNLITGGGVGPVFQLTSSTAVVSLASNGTLSVSGGIGISQSITWTGGSAVFEDSGLVLQGAIGVAISSPGTTQITAGSAQWNFTNDGALTVPGEIKSAANTGTVVINSSDGNTTSTWTFGLDGVLTLPPTIGDIKRNGVSVLGLGGFTTYQNSLYTADYGDAYFATFWDSGPGASYLKLPSDTNSTSSAVILSNQLENGAGVSIVASNPRNGNTEYSWNFGSDGTTHFPFFKFPATDGAAYQMLQTDGSGNLTWVDNAHNYISNGTSGVTIPGENGNVTISVEGNTIAEFTPTGVNITGNLNITNSATYIVSTNTVYTDSLIEIHAPTDGVGGAWTNNDLNDIGFRFHYYDGADKNAALYMDNGTWRLTWAAEGVETNGQFVHSGLGDIEARAFYGALKGTFTGGNYDGSGLRFDVGTGAVLYSTYDGNVYIQTGQNGTVYNTWQFTYNTTGTGGLVFPDSTVQTTAWTGAFTTATTSTLGGVKIGSGITITGDGTVSLNTGTLMTTAVQTVNAGGYSGNSVYYPAVWQGNNNNPDQLGLVSSFNINASSGLVTAASANITGPLTVKDVRDTVYSIGTQTSGTVTIDPTQGDVQTATLTGNITINGFTNPVSGQTVTLIITQDGVGSRTLTSTMKFAGGYKTLTTSPNAIDMMTISYIGSTYYASLITGFA